MAAKHYGQFEVAARTSTAKIIKRFRSALRSGDCHGAQVNFDMIEARGIARRKTIHQLQDQLFLACKVRR